MTLVTFFSKEREISLGGRNLLLNEILNGVPSLSKILHFP